MIEGVVKICVINLNQSGYVRRVESSPTRIGIRGGVSQCEGCSHNNQHDQSNQDSNQGFGYLPAPLKLYSHHISP
jgi:hypothetical protein